MAITAIDKTKTSGTSLADAHNEPFVTKMDALIVQSNTNETDITTAEADIVTIESALDQTDDFIRTDIDFSVVSATAYLEMFDVTGVVGTGTNVITGGKAELTTTNSTNDMESSLSNLAVFDRGDLVRASVDVDDVTDVEFRVGLYSGASKYFLITLKTGTGATLYAELDDGGGAQTMDLAITPVNGTALDIMAYTDADGTPHVVIDGTEIDISGTITDKLATDANKFMFDVKTLTTAARVLCVDWVKYKRAI